MTKIINKCHKIVMILILTTLNPLLVGFSIIGIDHSCHHAIMCIPGHVPTTNFLEAVAQCDKICQILKKIKVCAIFWYCLISIWQTFVPTLAKLMPLGNVVSGQRFKK